MESRAPKNINRKSCPRCKGRPGFKHFCLTCYHWFCPSCLKAHRCSTLAVAGPAAHLRNQRLTTFLDRQNSAADSAPAGTEGPLRQTEAAAESDEPHVFLAREWLKQKLSSSESSPMEWGKYCYTMAHAKAYHENAYANAAKNRNKVPASKEA